MCTRDNNSAGWCVQPRVLRISCLISRFFSPFLRYCPDTTRLNLCADALITDMGLLDVAANCPKLSQLFVCCCGDNITAAGNMAVKKLRPQLWIKE